MSELSYNSWLLKIHQKLNDRMQSAKLHRDGKNAKYRGINSEYEKSKQSDRYFKNTLFCFEPEFVITKTKRVNINPIYNNIKSIPCTPY